MSYDRASTDIFGNRIEETDTIFSTRRKKIDNSGTETTSTSIFGW